MITRAPWPLVIACVVLAGCAGAPPAPAGDTAPVWGDEYDGLLSDSDLADLDFHAARRSFAVDALASGDARTLRATAAAGPLSSRYRASSAGRAGALAFETQRLAVVAGAVRASLGEGALLADARDASSVEPRASRSLDGLRFTPSSSTWGSSLGAGLRVSLGRVRVAAGAWRERDNLDDARAFLSAGLVRAQSACFLAAGQSQDGARVLSVSAAHAAGTAFISGEAGMAPDGARVVARVVAGEGGQWRALVAAGAPAAAADPSPATASGRWGGAVERRGTWRGAANRVVLSTRSRRDGEGVERRQRAEWSSSFGAVEVGARATRETAWSATDLLDGEAPARTDDELRARAVVRAGEALADGLLRVEQAYRVEFIAHGAGPAGRVVAWMGRARWRGADARVHASAFDLEPGQLAYSGRAALPGAATFTTLARSGIDLSASLRLDAGRGVSLGVQAVRSAAGEARYALQAGVSW